MSSVADNKNSHELPKKWNAQVAEPELYTQWVENGYFTADSSSSKPSFSLVLPPPNVTGQLHMGHALDHTLMDSIARRKRMQGFEVLWVPGMDHAGIATQSKVEVLLKETEGKDRFDYGREEFIGKVWEWKDKYGSTIQTQMKALGDSVDWTRERFTLDEGLSRAVQTIFKALFDEGLVYKAHRMVNWSPVLETAISDIEVLHKDVDGELVSIRYGSLDDSQPHMIVATTRVETLLGDVAIAVHPEDERYGDLVGQTLPHPILEGETVTIIADDYVDPEFGTGAVKITPAHDPNDFEMGKRHNLDMPVIMDKTGKIADSGTRFDGMDRYEAREEIRKELEKQGRIVRRIHPYTHSVGHSERSGEPIEPRLSDQWFVKVAPLAQMASEAVKAGDTTIYPASQEPRYFEWVDNMHDWTISRQLWWGHRIPVWYGPEGEIVCVGPDDEVPTGEGWVQDPDVLDTWFSSALWPFSTLGWPDNTPDLHKFYPNSVLVTGYDILFFWVARMMMFGTFADTLPGSTLHSGVNATARDGRPQVPFTDLYLHGLVRDEHGRKMSKSMGNGINPLDWVEEYGADALRFALARAANPGTDIPLAQDAGQNARNFITKLFNASKFALMNGAHTGELPPRDQLSEADKWILDRLEEVRAQVDKDLDAYEFSKANEALFHFAWDEFCDWYLEIAKVQIPREWDAASPEEIQQGEVTQRVLGRVLDVLMKLLHPTIPFITERIWQALTQQDAEHPASLEQSAWPTSDDTNGGATTDSVAAENIEAATNLITEIRRFRADQGVKPSQKVPARIDFDTVGLQGLSAMIQNLADVESPDESFSPAASIEVRVKNQPIVVELDTSGTIDLEAEKKRLQKELSAAEKELTQTTAKLNNSNFVDKAPENVVAGIKERQSFAQEEVDRITKRLEQLQ